MHAPLEVHWQQPKSVLWYLKTIINHGLLLQTNTILSISTYSDADQTSSVEDRKSTTSYLVYFGNNLIFQNSKKQQTVSRSSTEAEYQAITSVATEVTWIQSLLGELKV